MHKENTFDKAEDGNLAFFLCITLVIMLPEVVIFWLLALEDIPLYVGIAIHLALVCLLGGYTKWLHNKQADIRFPMLLLITASTLGPFGCGITIATATMYKFYTRTSMPFSEWFASLFPENDEKEQDQLYERILLGLDETEITNIESFQNILEYGSLQQKQLVLAKITIHFCPEFAPALLKAVEDDNNAIRVQAATAIAKIEQQFVREFIKLEKRITKETATIDEMLAFARFCDEYAHSGIIDSDREQQGRQKAIETYEACQSLYPDDYNIKEALGRLYLYNNELEKAQKWLEAYIKNNKEVRPSLIAKYMEALFRMGKYSEVRQVARSHFVPPEESKSYTTKVEGLLSLWSKGADKKTLQLNVQTNG